MDFVIYNNEIVKKEAVTISPEDRGYNFGDGIYEVIRLYNRKPFAINEHLDRFFLSAKKLDLPIPYEKGTFLSLINELAEKNNLIDAIIYFQLTRGVSERNHLYFRNETPILTGFSRPFQSSMEDQTNGIKVWLTKDIRWLRCDIKTINLLGNVIVKREASDNQCKEALQHRDGIVTEGSSSNLFVVKKDTLYTHPANHFVLRGITRDFVIQLAKNLSLEVIEKPFSIEDLAKADEAFITSTGVEITPIVEIAGDISSRFSVGKITKQLQLAFADYILEKK